MMDVLFKGKSQPCEIRDLIREYHILPDQQSITPQALINIKLAIERRRKDVQNHKQFFLHVDVVTPPTLSEEQRLSIDRFARDWLAKALQEGSKNVISMLQALQATDPLFK